jgi:hypothetical protein
VTESIAQNTLNIVVVFLIRDIRTSAASLAMTVILRGYFLCPNPSHDAAAKYYEAHYYLSFLRRAQHTDRTKKHKGRPLSVPNTSCVPPMFLSPMVTTTFPKPSHDAA